MASYYVNDKAQTGSGDHEVHKSGCTFEPSASNRTYLGEFNSCAPAVTEAKKKYPKTSNGCATCCPDCHTG